MAEKLGGNTVISLEGKPLSATSILPPPAPNLEHL